MHFPLPLHSLREPGLLLLHFQKPLHSVNKVAGLSVEMTDGLVVNLSFFLISNILII